MPISWPWMRAKPVSSVSPYSGLNSWKRLSSTKRARISRVSVGILGSRLIRPWISRGSKRGGRLGC